MLEEPSRYFDTTQFNRRRPFVAKPSIELARLRARAELSAPKGLPSSRAQRSNPRWSMDCLARLTRNIGRRLSLRRLDAFHSPRSAPLPVPTRNDRGDRSSDSIISGRRLTIPIRLAGVNCASVSGNAPRLTRTSRHQLENSQRLRHWRLPARAPVRWPSGPAITGQSTRLPMARVGSTRTQSPPPELHEPVAFRVWLGKRERFHELDFTN